MSLRKLPEKVEEPRFQEPARGMYAKIPFKSDMTWVTILNSEKNYTLVCYEDKQVDYVVTSCLKGCPMKPNHPALKIKTGDCVHLAMNSDFTWANVLDVDRDYVLVKYMKNGKTNWVLQQSIVAKIKPEKKGKKSEEKGLDEEVDDRFDEPARGMYAKIPYKSDMIWVTILDSEKNYTLVCYEDKHVDYVVTSCLKGCPMKPNHPALKIEIGDCVHLAMNSGFSWASVLDVDRYYVLVRYMNGEKNWVLQRSIVAKTQAVKKGETNEVAEEKGNKDQQGQAGRVWTYWTGNTSQKVLLGLM